MTKYRHYQIQASPVAEGVRLRIGDTTAFAVRQESKDVALRLRHEERPLRRTLRKLPFVRGMSRLVGGAADFVDGIMESAELQPQPIVKGNRFERRFAELFQVHPTAMVAFGSALVILILMIGLCLVAPMFAARYVQGLEGITRARENAIVCAVRELGALICMVIIPRLRVVNRLCMYRGAINKVVNAYVDGAGYVSQESAAKAPLLARRSDSAFIALTVLLSIAAFALVRTYTLPVQLLVRALIMLVVAGIVNEPVRWLERQPRDRFAAKLLAPMQWLQRLFVANPHNQMIEVALFAFNAAREND